MKRCSKCGEEKEVELFSFKNVQQGKRHSHCKSCVKNGWMRMMLDPAIYEKIMISGRRAKAAYAKRNPDKVRGYQKKHYLKIGHKPLRKRFEILRKFNFKCVYCGATSDTTTLHIDHFIPTSKGGTNVEENLVVACRECNLGKSDILLN